MAATILLPEPQRSTSMSLGQLLSDPLNPSSLSFAGSPPPQTSINTTTESSFKDVVSRDNQGRLLSRVTDPTPSPEQQNHLQIQATTMEHARLKNASTSFNTLTQDPSARTFLRKMAPRNQPLYYVTGIQRLKAPTFKPVTSAPAPNTRLPTPFRRDSGMVLQDVGNADIILGVELRKVKVRVGHADEPHALEDIDYAWMYQALEAEAGLQLSVGLGRAVRAPELWALAGVVVEEEGTEGSLASCDSEDEGLAGF